MRGIVEHELHDVDGEAEGVRGAAEEDDEARVEVFEARSGEDPRVGGEDCACEGCPEGGDGRGRALGEAVLEDGPGDAGGRWGSEGRGIGVGEGRFVGGNEGAERGGLDHLEGDVDVWEPGAVVDAEDVGEGFSRGGVFLVGVDYADYVHRAADEVGIVVEVFTLVNGGEDIVQAGDVLSGESVFHEKEVRDGVGFEIFCFEILVKIPADTRGFRLDGVHNNHIVDGYCWLDTEF